MEVLSSVNVFDTDLKKYHQSHWQSRIFDDPAFIQGYESVPFIEIDTLLVYGGAMFSEYC
jgi:hypothetical protein